MSTPHQLLQKYFGFDQFRPGQEEAIRRVLTGQSTLLVMPTGSGKSLAYQLPALSLPGLTLVISPLIALMKDQVDSLVEAGLPATFVNSSLPNQELNRRLRAVQEGQVKLLYIAPERLRRRDFTRVLANVRISLLAVDEAHCISQWGHDFRPDYLQIGPTWQAMGRPTLLATTATATPAVQKDIVTLLGLAEAETIVTGFNRPNLTFRVTTTPDTRTKLQALQALLRRVEGSVIIYAATRRNTDEVANFVQDVVGRPVGAYHAGLDRELRHRVQTDFMADRLKVVVATNAFGMGVDKPDVRTVIHYNMPANVEAYYQEAGRAGRDGLPAECVLLFAPDDQRLQEWLINSDTPSHQDLSRVHHMLSQAASQGEVYFAPRELAEMSGLHPVTIRVTLSELEQAGVIVHLGDQRGYGHWRVLPLDRATLQERAAAINRRAQIRLELLGTMLDYAYLTTCRRKYLLNYFGDASPPKSPRCCDNHTEDSLADLPKAVTPQEWFPLIVLETVRSLQHRPVGRKRLAQILTGSQAKGMAEFGYDRHRFYGKLDALSQPQLTGLIDALIGGRYLRLGGGELPVLTLSPSGQQALEARVALPLRMPGLAQTDDRVERWQKGADRSDTVMQTFELFQQGLNLAEIAAERELKESTIYSHLARLIGDGKLDLAEVVPAEIEAQVLEAVATVGSAGHLNPLKTILPDEIGYDQIKCVLAAHPELPAAGPASQSAETPEQRVVALGQTGDPAPQPFSSSASLPTPTPDIVILEAVAELGGALGRTGLAQFLTGSKAAWLETFVHHSYYGRLGDLSQKAVLNVIDALIADGKLTTTGGHRPKVVLPDQLPRPPQLQNLTGAAPGQEAEAGKKEADKDGQSTIPAKTETAGTDFQPDSDLLETLQAWRTEQARTQQKPPYIIFSNKVLESIAARRPATLAELADISGVGPAKLEQYGVDILALIAGKEPAQTEPGESASSIAETATALTVPQTASPQEIILAVVTDLDGLLTVDGLAQLLTAGPDEVVSFSDHPHFATLHGTLTTAEISQEIRQAIDAGQLALSAHQRLISPA